MEQRVWYCGHQVLQLVPTWSEMNPVHTSYPFSFVPCNIMLTSSKWYLLSRFDKVFCAWLICPVCYTRCSPEVMHKFLLWLYKSCCRNPASWGRRGWLWAWREPSVSIQGPVYADSNVVSVSDYFHTDSYGVLTRRTACHHKIFFAKGENCVNIHRELVSVWGDSALDYSNVNRWMAKFKKGKCPAPTCRTQGDRAHLARMPTKNVLKTSFRVTAELP